jgi:hypothetical protein
MLFREVIAVYSENHTKPLDTPCWQNAELFRLLKHMHTHMRVGTSVLQRVKFRTFQEVLMKLTFLQLRHSVLRILY